MDALVAGVIFDYSVLVEENPGAISPALAFLRKLRHSILYLGICYEPTLSRDKVNLVKNLANQYYVDCFKLDDSYTDGSLRDIHLAWGTVRGKILCVVSKNKQELNQIRNFGWIIVIVDAEGAVPCDDSSTMYISKVEELYMTICLLNRKAAGNSIQIVGYIMKPSREEDFAKRGAFPLWPTPNGLMFLPLTFDLPLLTQLQHVDIVLQKATDEINSVELSNSSESSITITYTIGMKELQRFMEHHPSCLVIDPLDKIYSVLDRLKIQQVLLGLEDLKKEGSQRIRGPNFLKVDDFDELDVKRLTEAKLSLPSIVKPQVACGVADAHSMAIVFRVEDFKGLSVPLPAIVQEYVDHSSTLFKIYVLGEKVFYAVKKSIPNADMLTKLSKLSESNGLGPLLFDSLKSLPTSNSGDPLAACCFDFDLVTEAAHWLAKKLDLTIFGFDVVIQEGSNDHVVVDVNYLPSFKEVPIDTCIPAFWEAIKRKFESRGKVNVSGN